MTKKMLSKSVDINPNTYESTRKNADGTPKNFKIKTVTNKELGRPSSIIAKQNSQLEKGMPKKGHKNTNSDTIIETEKLQSQIKTNKRKHSENVAKSMQHIPNQTEGNTKSPENDKLNTSDKKTTKDSTETDTSVDNESIPFASIHVVTKAGQDAWGNEKVNQDSYSIDKSILNNPKYN